jgi:hypothetical protein
LQAKLRIGQLGDVYEQEADRVADVVMQMLEPSAVYFSTLHIQRACLTCEEDELRRQPIEEEEKELLQTKEISGENAETTPYLESCINAIRGGGQPLAESERAYFGPSFGRDFSQVQVHTDDQAAEAAQAVNARAYTVGQDVVFGAMQAVRVGVHAVQQTQSRITSNET